MKLKTDAKFAQIENSGVSRIREGAVLISRDPIADDALVLEAITQELKNMGYSGLTTGSLNAGCNYTVIWDPSTIEIIQ